MGKNRKRALTGFGVTLLFILAFAIFFFLNFRTVVVSGDSMLPTFRSGQRVLVSKAYWLVGPIRRKDVVVMRAPEASEFFIKRVYRLPGEEVDLANAPRSWSLTWGEFRVPEGSVFVLGDNLPHSEDSRQLGPVPLRDIIGKVVVLRP
jgi:signal peptidase I